MAKKFSPKYARRKVLSSERHFYTSYCQPCELAQYLYTIFWLGNLIDTLLSCKHSKLTKYIHVVFVPGIYIGFFLLISGYRQLFHYLLVCRARRKAFSARKACFMAWYGFVVLYMWCVTLCEHHFYVNINEKFGLEKFRPKTMHPCIFSPSIDAWQGILTRIDRYYRASINLLCRPLSSTLGCVD